MANNQKKLKAFVRYDGSGRVVASSLILRKNKPRVGRWFEIPTYECCNETTTTTTTTGIPTTTTTTTPTVYDFTGGYGLGSAGEACFAGMTQTFYSTTPYVSVANGSVLYTDAGLTTPVTYPYVALTGLNKVFSCSNGVLSNQSSCN